MTEADKRQALNALKGVALPGGGDLPGSGMIRALDCAAGVWRLTLDIGDPARAEALEPVRRMAERALAALPGAKGATAVMTAERPSAAATRTGAATPADGRSPRETGKGDARIRHIIAVASGKGGVGKSTTAVNLAFALAGFGLRVGLLDADVYGPSLPRMTGVRGKPQSLDGKIMQPLQSHGVKMMSIGFLVSEEQPVVWRGLMVTAALRQLLHDVDWGPLDVLVVDMPPGTGDAQLTLAQEAKLSGAVIVSTPQDIALLDARKGLEMFRKVNTPVLGVVENMSFFCCPSCGHRAEIFGHGGARAEAARLGCDFLGEIPLHIDIRLNGDAGRPVAVAAPDGPHAAAYRAIADKVRSALRLAPGDEATSAS